jgi:spore coat polysaccharide biosynthesis protein SpsF
VIATIEARMTSTRLPGKVLMRAGGKPLLQILIERLLVATSLHGIVVATTTNATDDPIVELAQHLGVAAFRGSEDDVLGRVCGALDSMKSDVCVEITGDCPLIDPAIVDCVVGEFFRTYPTHEYVSTGEGVPSGLDVQVFAAAALHVLHDTSPDALDREHVSYGFYRDDRRDRWKPRWITPPSCVDGAGLVMTLDYPEDYELLRHAHEALAAHAPLYSAVDLIAWVRSHPELEEPCWARRREPVVQ